MTTEREALQKVRAMIRGKDVEHAVVDLARMDEGLGAYIDRVLAEPRPGLTVRIDAQGIVNGLLTHAEGAARIFVEGLGERVRQDEQWGGPATDDTRGPNDWARYIRHQIRYIPSEPMGGVEYGLAEFRQRMVNIMALAIAAIQSYDRVNTPSDLDTSPDEFGHVLWKKGDENIPAHITDRNGDVTLGLCKVCGRAEAELEHGCIGERFAFGGTWQPIGTIPKDGTRVQLLSLNGMFDCGHWYELSTGRSDDPQDHISSECGLGNYIGWREIQE